MILITSVRIQNFRSIRDLRIEGASHMNAIAGLNNSGKSNILKSLNLFFNNEIEAGIPLIISKDYSIQTARSQKKKLISISVNFSLPEQFNFRKELEPVKLLLSDNDFKIEMIWDAKAERSILLNDQELSLEDQVKVLNFLKLIKFRYIPNRTSPIDIIRSEQHSLRNALVNRLGKTGSDEIEAFGTIKAKAADLVRSFSGKYASQIDDFSKMEISTPNKWRDIVLDLSYRFQLGDGIFVSEDYQGSGAQSAMMLETLNLIDGDYSKSYGWRQATIWAFEEPETSLHHSLVFHTANRLRALSDEPKSRLQVFCSTHSNPVAQHSNAAYLAKKSGGATSAERLVTRADFRSIATQGIAEHQHPLAAFPRDDILLVEGKHDAQLFEGLKAQINGAANIAVTYLEELDEDDRTTGGDDETIKYLKRNKKAITESSAERKILVAFDWDVSIGRIRQLNEYFDDQDLFAYQWPEEFLNPDLGSRFRGYERSLSTNFVREVADEQGIDLPQEANGQLSVLPERYGELKLAIAAKVSSGVAPEATRLARGFLSRIVEESLL